MSTRDTQSEEFLNSDTVNDEFFIEIVEKKLQVKRDKFKLRLVLLSPATGKNENFISVVYRAEIKIELIETKTRKSVNVILKVLLTTNEALKKFSVFPREIFLYENVLDSFEKIWEERADEKIKFGPRCIKIESDPYEIIVLDDLKAEGYEMLDRKVGLNFEQSKLLLTKLAKFHAAGAIRYQKDGIIEKHLDRKASMPPMPKDPENDPMSKVFKKQLSIFQESIWSYGDCDKYAEKISRWSQEKFLMSWIDIAEPMKNGFTILNHGDTWINNMMFKFNEANDAIDVSLIDFQLSYWASPVGDFLYFIISSVEDVTKVERFDELVEFYHHELTESLKKLKYDQPIPTLCEFHVDMLEKAPYVCACLNLILFVVKNDSNEELNMEDLMKNSEKGEQLLRRLYSNETYKKAMREWLPFLNKRGFLDTMIVQEVPEIQKPTAQIIGHE